MAAKRKSKRITLTPEQLEERRMKGYAMLKRGVSQSEVARRLGVTRGSVNHWAKIIGKEGKRGLRAREHTGRNPKLDRKLLKKLPGALLKGAEGYGFEGDVWTLERIAAVVKKEYGVKYNPHHVAKLLHKLGLSWKKPRTQAIQRDDEATKKWVQEEWPKLKNGRRASEP